MIPKDLLVVLKDKTVATYESGQDILGSKVLGLSRA